MISRTTHAHVALRGTEEKPKADEFTKCPACGMKTSNLYPDCRCS